MAGDWLAVADDFHVGVERVQPVRGGLDLGATDGVGIVQDLALQVGRVDVVEVDDAERAHARGGEV